MKRLETYRGATLYEVIRAEESEGRRLNYKVVAEGLHPKQGNMKIDFIEEAGSQEQALNGIKIKIDRYLKEHGLQSLNPTNYN